jgi:hypothetical protein
LKTTNREVRSGKVISDNGALVVIAETMHVPGPEQQVFKT